MTDVRRPPASFEPSAPGLKVLVKIVDGAEVLPDVSDELITCDHDGEVSRAAFACVVCAHCFTRVGITRSDFQIVAKPLDVGAYLSSG